MKTFMFIRHVHWLTIGLQLKQHFDQTNQHLQLVASSALLKQIALIGARFGDDLIELRECQKQIRELEPEEVGALVHHHEKFSSDLIRLLGGDPFSRPLTINFFADGYNNQLLHGNSVGLALAEQNFLKPGKVFFFDVQENALPGYLPGFTAEIVTAETLFRFSTNPALQAKAQLAITQSVSRAEGRKLLLLMLRPWGSTVFHNGRLALEDSPRKLAQGMAELIGFIERDIGEEVCVAIRPDDRDRALMEAFLEEFPNHFAGKFFNINEYWPKEITMEPFIYNFSDFAKDAYLAVASLDSTASLPFVKLKKGARHYLGAPDNVLSKLLDRGEAAEAVRMKIGRVARHARTLAKTQTLSVEALAPHFVRVTT